MANYTLTTAFLAKDALPSGDADKVVKGADFETEFTAVETASATKSNKISSAVTGNVIEQDSAGDLVNSGYSFSGLVGDLAITKAEFDTLDGITSTTAELNILDGVNATASELNTMDGITATTSQLNNIATTTSTGAELDILDGATLSTAELNLMDGVTSTTVELNYTDGVTSAIQTQFNTITANDWVTQARMANNTVGQAELKDTTGIVSTTSILPALTKLTLPSGQYGFYPQVRGSVSSTSREVHAQISEPSGATEVTSYVTRITMGIEVAGTAFAQQRYFTASPPYDLGDGEIPLFVFAIIDNSTSDVESVYVALEAPWHYNGKTSIIATRKDIISGKSYQQVKQIKAELMDTGKSIAQAVTDKTFTFDAIADRLINDAMVEVELTQAIKNADMVDIPHPFLGNSLTGKSVVMLDPVSTEKLLALHEVGEDLNTLIHDGTLKINTSPIVRATPIGVLAYGFTL